MEIDQKEQESKQNRKKVGRIDLKKKNIDQKEKESKQNRAKAEET